MSDVIKSCLYAVMCIPHTRDFGAQQYGATYSTKQNPQGDFLTRSKPMITLFTGPTWTTGRFEEDGGEALSVVSVRETGYNVGVFATNPQTNKKTGRSILQYSTVQVQLYSITITNKCNRPRCSTLSP